MLTRVCPTPDECRVVRDLRAEIERLRAALTEIRDAALYNDHLIKEAVIKRCEGALEQEATKDWTMAKPSEAEIDHLITNLQGAPQQYRHVPGRGDPEKLDCYRLTMTGEQRNLLVRALMCLHDVNRK